jgi:hypothetical protein
VGNPQPGNYHVVYYIHVTVCLFILDGSIHQIDVNKVGGACGTHGRGKKRVQGFGVKARSKEPLERPRRRWVDGIKMDLREFNWGGGGVHSPCSG